MIKAKIKKMINNIELMLLIVILITSTLCIRNTKAFEKIQIAIFVIMSIYTFIRCINKNNIKLIQSKLDIFVLLLIISTIIPQIMNTYVSLKMTITTILEYLTIFWIYILTKEVCKKNSKATKYLKNILIILIVLLIFIGIDNLSSNIFMNLIKSNNIINGEERLVSLFGNPNAFAAVIIFSLAISINEMLNSNNTKLKIIYATCNTIFLLGIMLTYSKFVFLILPFVILTYIIKNKCKNERIYIVNNVLISILASIIYVLCFQKFLKQEYHIAIFIFTIFWIELMIISNYILLKITKAIGKMSHKKIWILALTLTILGILFIRLELKNTDKLVVFDKNINTTYYSKIINNVEPNEEYNLTFYINSKSEYEDMFTIRVIQRDDKVLDEIETKEISLGNYSGKKEISIKTTPNTKELKIEIKTKYIETPKQLIIDRLEINGKEVVLAYKHLPSKLVEKIKNINIQYKTAKERFIFLKDGLKLVSNNFLTGIGGNCWQFKYGEVQEYGYKTKDTHSYYIQIWLEFGILGIIGIIGIIICLLKSKKDIGIKIGIFAILIHSAMDSDMYFTFIKIIIFISLGILAETLEEEKKKKDYLINSTLIIISILSAIMLINPAIYDKKLVVDKLEEKQKILDSNTEEYKECSLKIAKESYNVIKYERYQSIQSDYEIKRIQNYINSQENDLEKIVSQYYERISTYKNKWKYNCDEILEKSNNISIVIQMLENQNDNTLYEWIAKLAKINIDEYEETREQLQIAFNDKYKKLEEQIEYNNLISNYNLAVQMYNKYFTGVAIINNTAKDIRKYINDDDIELKNKKDILIYYTHTTEAYNSTEYEETEYRKTLNPEYNILAVGEELEKNLNLKGLEVTNIKEYNDLDGNKYAYNNSAKLVKEELNQKDTQIIFDVHRDSYGKDRKEKSYIEINSESVAKMRFVISANNENWVDNLKWAIKIQKKADELYPGLFNPIYIKKGDYNQELSKFSELIEVGEDNNTIEEAKRSVKYFSDILEKVIEEI